MELQKAVERIERMERLFDSLCAAAMAGPEATRAESFQRDLAQLLRYYEGGQWLRDYTLDEQDLLPRDLKRGVLSQDGVYDLLDEIREQTEKDQKQTVSRRFGVDTVCSYVMMLYSGSTWIMMCLMLGYFCSTASWTC